MALNIAIMKDKLINIEIKDQISSSRYPMPDNDLDEFTDWEFGLIKYFYGNVKIMLLKIGTEKFPIPYYTDLCFVFKDFQVLTHFLKINKNFTLNFVERYVKIVFVLIDDEMYRVELFNEKQEFHSEVIEKSLIISEFEFFTSSILNDAILQGYITENGKKEFLKLPPYTFL
jgi:hypothetical protein